jgi:ABC-type ATPase with predicted acetyltransferase domain
MSYYEYIAKKARISNMAICLECGNWVADNRKWVCEKCLIREV